MSAEFVVSKMNGVGLGDRPCALLWMRRVAAVAEADRNFGIQPFLYLITQRGQLLEPGNGK